MITIASGVTVSTAANTKSADLISGTYQFIGKGTVTLACRGSAAGMNATLSVGGVPLCDDLPLLAFGATGGLSIKDHIQVSQAVTGGRVQFFLRNTSGGALTTDYVLYFEPK
jgi:hypothetical protein